MRWLRFAVLVLFITILQAGSLLDVIAVTHLSVRPDLLLILLVFFAVSCDSTEAIITSFTIGFAADLIGSVMGPRMVGFGLLGTALAYLHRVVAIRKMPHQSAAVFVACFLTGALVSFLTFLTGQPMGPRAYTALLGTSIYSAVVGPFLFLPLAWWMRIKTNRLSRA